MKYFIISLICLLFSSPVWAASTQQKLYNAAEKGELANVRKALKAGADVDKQDKDGWTALLYATMKGHQPVVQLLLSAGADPDIAGNKGETPLVGAVLSDNAGLVKILLDAGADSSIKLMDGTTALDVAHKRGSTEIVSLLESGSATLSPSPKTDVSALQPSIPNPKVSIEDMRKLIPQWALPEITDKTLEYMKLVAETWPMGRDSETEKQMQTQEKPSDTPVNNPHGYSKETTRFLAPGIHELVINSGGFQYSSSTSNDGALTTTEVLKVLVVGGQFGPAVASSDNADGSSFSEISNMVSHEGQLFPLRIGNTEKISTINKTKHVGTPGLGDSEGTTDTLMTVIDKFDGESVTNFPIPLKGNIFVIGQKFTERTTSSSSDTPMKDYNSTRLWYYSEDLKTFIPLKRPEDAALSEFGNIFHKIISFKLLN
jgi:uncharacterized protein